MSIRIGVIGVGSIGEHHVRNYSAMKQVELIGIYDVDPDKAQRVAKNFGTIAYSDLSKLLNKIEAVSICVPNQLHKEMAISAISEGVHILIEKPVSATLEEADAIIEAANKHDVRATVGHVERFNPAILTLSDAINKEDLLYIEAQRLSPHDPGKKVGVVLDMMIHDIDVVLSLVDTEIKHKSSITRKIHSKTEDIAHAQIVFENGVIATFTASRVIQKRVRLINVTLEGSYISADYLTQEVFIRSNLKSEYIGGKNISYKQVSAMEIPYVQRYEPLRNELEHFVSSLENNTKFLVSLEDARKSLATALELTAEKATTKTGAKSFSFHF